MRYLARVVCALLALAACLWIAAIALLWSGEPRIVYRASWTRNTAPFDSPVFRPLAFDSTDQLRLDAVTLEHGSADAYWILYFNGAAGSIHRRRERDQLQQLQEIGYNVFAFDYRGFGRNAGTPTEAGVYDDAMAAYRYLTGSRHVDPSRLILAGRSLGSAVAVEVATRVRSAGLLLLSPIDSVPLVGSRLYPWAPVRLLASNQFDSLGKIERVTVPVLMVLARNDRLVPLEAGRALYARARGVKVMLETGGGHNRAGFAPFDDLQLALARLWPAGEVERFSETR